MSPEAAISNRELVDSQSALDLYLGVIGLDHLPESPNDLPSNIALPSGLLIPISRGMEETLADGRERGGYIKWDTLRKQLISRRYSISTNKWTMASPRFIFPSWFGEDLSILDWHTHPTTSLPSHHDVVTVSGKALIELVGASGYIDALVHTKQSLSFAQTDNQDWSRIYNNQHSDPVETAGQIGLGFYSGTLSKDGKTQLRKVRKIKWFDYWDREDKMSESKIT